MKIDWDNAPEDATHYDFGISGDLDEPPSFMRFDYRGCYFWDEDSQEWEEYGEHGDYTKEVVLDRSIPRPASNQTNEVTVKEIRQLAINSGLQIEFHANGDIYVWDDTYEEGTRVSSLEEYVRLAEAKAAYVKLWADYIWE